MVVTATQENLVELRVVEEVGPVSVNQGAESQAVLPATSANQQREPTCQMSSFNTQHKKGKSYISVHVVSLCLHSITNYTGPEGDSHRRGVITAGNQTLELRQFGRMGSFQK